ncbi:MAG: G-protein coupled receptor [Candidatus Paceibacterota bacterium]
MTNKQNNVNISPRKSKKVVAISFLFSVFLAVLSIFISNLIITPSPWGPVYFFWGFEIAKIFSASVLFTFIASVPFIILNFFAVFIFRKHRSIRVGLLLGYLSIILIYLVSLALYGSIPSLNTINQVGPEDASQCAEMQVTNSTEGALRNYCYIEVAEETLNIDLCDDLVSEYVAGDIQSCKDNINLKLALENLDANYCENIVYSNNRNTCNLSMSLQTENYSLCTKIIEGGVLDTEMCYMRFIKQYNSEEIRNELCPLIKNHRDNVNNPCNKPIPE